MRALPGTASIITNGILAVLPPDDWAAIRPHLTRVRLVPGQVLLERGQPTEHAFFLEEGITSLVVEAETGQKGVQVAMIGNEGMIGGLALLGHDSATFAAAITQIPGSALRIPVSTLRHVTDECPTLHRACLKHVQAMTRQIMQTAAYNARATLVERCVRWLLMAHDRIEGDDLPVTHEALSAMLGVRRSGVTVATAALQEDGLIRTSRGRIRVLDRAGLQEALLGRGRARAAVTRLNAAPAAGLNGTSGQDAHS